MVAARLILLAGLVAVPGVARAEPPLLLQAEAADLKPVCTGRDLQLEGNHNTLAPFGICRSLLVKGVGNRVVLALPGGAALRVEGSGNQVTYAAPAAATVDTLGDGNAVTAQVPGPGAEAGLGAEAGPVLLLSGDDKAGVADCAGRVVRIEGSRSFYVLRGGCAGLIVAGDLITVQAALQPGVQVVVTGHGDRVGWVLAGHGRAPAAVLHGVGNHVQRLDGGGGDAVGHH